MQIAIQTTEIASEYLSAAREQDAKAPQNLKHKYDLKCNEEDEYGRPVKEIYAQVPAKYVVYVTDDDMIHTLAEEEEILNQRVDINEERANIRDFKENADSLRTKYQNSYASALVSELDRGSKHIHVETLAVPYSPNRFGPELY